MRSYGWRWTRTPYSGDGVVNIFWVSRAHQRDFASREAQNQPGAPFPSHSVRHADPFTSEWLRDLGVPATSGHTPGRNKELSRVCWNMPQVLRLVRAHWLVEIWELAAFPCGGVVMSSYANLTSIWLISRQYRVPVLPPATCPGHRQAGKRQSRSCESTDRRRPCFMTAVAPTQRRIPCNLGMGALQGRRTNAMLLYSVRGAPIHLNGNPRININPIPAPRTDGTCMVANATHALSRGLGAARASADQRLSAYEVGQWSSQMGIPPCVTLRPSPAKNTRIGKVSAGFYCQAALRP